ncbi:hypothetical protein K8640_02515 [Myxococcus sp. XM-1-1-1]|uniref:hypothetical protein n=1 Tax=Myxococcus sp. XM-1-1-1 TaxID=2874602 RepID=UPI001CC11CE1|nr:hypothetical protein [Myxococcus sp. XM-1-1-1]MBZ4407071.1 hypothetical protein [Myxococcus sp. XM-1-1-1]
MKRSSEQRKFVGVAFLTAALAVFSSACGDDDEKQPQQQTPDSGTPDSGTPDSGTPDSGTPDAGPGTALLDSDIGLMRFNADGTVDTTFGASGTTRLDLTTVVPGGARDSVWGVAADATDRLVVFGARRGDGDRVDADRVVVRFGANGTLDTTFATNGVHTLNISNLSDGARNGIVQADGKILASGYTSQPTGAGTQAANRIVLLRLDDAGKPDNSFGWKGVVNDAPFGRVSDVNPEWGMAEAYTAGQLSDGSYVTTGYGRSASTGTVDMVNFKYKPNGERDLTFGTGGVVLLDLVGDNDRGRNLVVLNDDRVVTVGSATPAAQKIQGLIHITDKNGVPTTQLGTDGYKLYDFERPEQAFFGVAKSQDGNWVAAAGYRAGGDNDDDAVLVILPVGANPGADIAIAAPISETENDRFWSVAFDSTNRIYAAGFVTEGGDNRLAVARYTTAGVLDTSFGTGGVVKHNFSVGKTEEAVRGIVVQSDGKIVVAATVEK